MKPLYTFIFFLLSFSLSAQNEYNFTNCSQTGYTGPSESQVTEAYLGTSLEDQAEVVDGIQHWTVPTTGTYRLIVAGASGGKSNSYGGDTYYSRGAKMQGDFFFNSGEVIKILVGQQGQNNTYDGGGGGGSFVVTEDDTPLIIAGGGGGQSSSSNTNSYTHGQAETSPLNNSNGNYNNCGGDGNGGGSCTTAGGGGGFYSNGCSGWYGYGFLNGGNGYNGSADGGFGGGAGGGGTNGAGGGGGYSGGYGSCWSYAASGGGSYNSGQNQLNETGGHEWQSHGFVSIELLCEEEFITEVYEESGAYSWRGNTYTVGGTYTDTSGITSEGCDSVYVLNLTMPTGNGVIISMNPSYSFNQTIVDSTTSTTVTVSNSLGTDQVVSFENISDPFSVSENPTIISANSDAEITFSFTPSSIGSYTDTLDFSGNIFGGGQVIFNGEGIQVDIEVSDESVFLDTVSIGQSNSYDLTIFNYGTGDLVIDSIVVNGSDELSVSPTSLIVSEEGSETITLTYSPINSGDFENSISIFSNDPADTEYVINISAVGISQVSGEACGTWTLANSPYELVGNIVVPDSCSLILEPGVTVDLNSYNFSVYGGLTALGNESDSITLVGGRLFFSEEASIDSISSLKYAYEFFNPDTTNYGDLNYVENWTVNSSYQNYSNFSNSGGIYLQTYTSSQNYNLNQYEIHKNDPFVVAETGFYRISSEYRCTYQQVNTSTREYRNFAYYKINDEEWIEFFKSHDSPYFNDYEEFASEIIFLEEGDELDIYFYNYSTSDYYRRVYFRNTNLNKVSGFEGTAYLNDCETLSPLDTYEYCYVNDDGLDLKCLTIGFNNTFEEQEESAYDINANYAFFETENITIPESGSFFIEFDIMRDKVDAATSHNVYYKLNNGDWIKFLNGNFSDNTYGYTSISENTWRKERRSLGNFSQGDQLIFKFEVYRSNSYTSSSYDEISIKIDNIRFYYDIQNSILFSERSLKINNSNIEPPIYTTNDYSNLEVKSSSLYSAMTFGKYSHINLNDVKIENSLLTAIETFGDNADINCYNVFVSNNFNGISSNGDNSDISITYSKILNNENFGIKTSGTNSKINLYNSMITLNGGYGVSSRSQVNSNYSNITFNDKFGFYFSGNSFNNIKNTIVWGNDIIDYKQINTVSGVTSITYSSVQGLGAYGTEGSQYYYGDGAIDDDPVFTDMIDQYLSSFSNCVDAGTPWQNDNHMPFGLGGVRADIGIYGGPDNWFWGGEPIPDGSPVITGIADSPQDQGGIVGVLFDKSVWDDNDLENKVTSYSIWRNFDAEGNSIDTISDGNWQLMGYMPAQAFDAYAYEAPTLGDSSLAEGSFNSCFVVLAHTVDSSVYWYSDVFCGYSTDDLSPASTEVFAELTPTEEVMISWNPPADDDYAYSEVISSFGFNTSNITDTLTYDMSFDSGDLITYGVIHYDVNGNPSDTSFVSIQIEDQKDYIPLYAGWNLISTRLTPNDNDMQSIFSSLELNNLIYVTGFNNGVSVYDPNGLPFLNTLSQFEDGYGYWVKVNEDDTLVINGNPISHDFIPPYNAGWNLMGYLEGYSQSVSSYFDFLLDEDNLIYVTNFNQGAAFYDPSGLPFLNSLNYVEDNLGYWVKTVNPFGGISLRLSHDSQHYSPNFMLLNGQSNLSEYIGEKVQVYNQDLENIAELEIIEGGYLMTNAIYGDDPTTEQIEGLEDGELLSFGFMSHVIEDKIEFYADMNLRKVKLNFEVSDVISVYPNPTKDVINISINEANDCELDIQIFDIAGRLVYSDLNRTHFKGADKVSIDFSEFENGAYYLKLSIDNDLRFNESIIKQ
jgi:hypothetical protein